MKWQIFRKLVQLSSVFFIVYTALNMHWRNFKVAHNNSRIVGLMTNEWYAELYRWNNGFLSFFGDPLAVSEGFLGGPWAATVAGVPVIDPYAVAAVLAGGSLPTLTMILGAVTPILLALVLGKVFCSYLCPARLAFEIGGGFRTILRRLGVPVMEAQIPRLGLYVGLGAVLFAAGAGPAIFQFVLPYYAISAGLFGYFAGGSLLTVAFWAFALVAVDAIIAPGQICRSLCPTGALLEQFGRKAVVRVDRRGGECPPSCDVCQRACPYGLFPARKEHLPACDSCARCVAVCPQQKLGFEMKTHNLAALAAIAGLLAAGGAQAHHNKGLPHYGYFENYPQVPTEEFIDEVGRWEIGAVFFNFQGMDRRSSDTPGDVRVFAYVFDLQEERGYKGALTLHIEDAEGKRIGSYDRVESDEEGVYVIRQAMPATGDYQLIFDMDVDGEHVEVPLDFEIDLSAGSVDWWLLGGAAGGLLVLFGIAAAGRQGKGERSAAPVRVEESHGS
jgi:ferredoxin-type protein NapH